MMKQKLLLVLTLVMLPLITYANVVDPSLISKVTVLGDDIPVAMDSHPYSDSVKQNIINSISAKLDTNQDIKLFGEKASWLALEGDSAGTHILRFSVSASAFTTGELKISGAGNAALYLNKVHIKGNSTYTLNLLNQDYRVLLIVNGVENWQDFTVEWIDSDQEASSSSTDLKFGNDSHKKRASMKQYYDSETVGVLNVSPDGEYLVWSKSHYTDASGDKAQRVTEILALESQQVVYRWQGMNPARVTWQLDSSGLVFMHSDTLYHLELKTKHLKEVATNLPDIRDLTWLSKNEIIVSWHKSEDKPHEYTKRYRALQDRWSYWRGDLQINVLDIESGLLKQLTNDALKTNLLDVDTQTRMALIVRSPTDYKAPPHSLSRLLELNLSTGEERLIGEYRTFNNAQYHKNGIVILAGPSFDNGTGNNVSQATVVNDYDGQLYLLDHKGEVSALSKDFSPAINQVVGMQNGNLVLLVTQEDRRKIYQYDIKKGEFSPVNTQVDVVSGMSLSKQKRPVLVYKGTSATTPQRVLATNMRGKKQTVLYDSASTHYANIDFVDAKDWDYTTESGQFIDGRVYYPSGFDEQKSYPAIIYYYGGTVPVTRGYTGRWPFSMWASKGYVVYVLQPSGTVGYGQEFSARHVNAWGINTADEIIESTKAFVRAHPFVDATKLGNMGASYGGFMTMYLATKTDMFAASISHAGISNLTSYWGEGWWGYGYSGIATRGAFPWNSPDFYVQQSPVFGADNVNSPLLLLHGDADTNVPVGESHQMYTALMLLGKDVELIEFQGDDHHVNARERRMRWWSTIVSYFDMKLKQQPQWWEHLYPQAEQNK